MSIIKKIEKNWLKNFKNSALVKDGIYNPESANGLFYGFEESTEPSGKFELGFRAFNDNFDFSNPEPQIEKLITYLHFIGITLSKSAINSAVTSGRYSYEQILKKAFYLLKQLATYDMSLNINDPFYDNMGDLYFFLRLEEGDSNSEKQLTFFDEIELPDLYNKYIDLPREYENDETALNLFVDIESSNDSYFVTGKAGTGKSTFIHFFTKNTDKSVLLLAFTGIAAINIGGQTIHSFFGFPFKPLLPGDNDIPVFKKFVQKRKILEKVNTIIIDEVSMLRSDILEGLDYSLRNNGGNPNLKFGGKQMIFVGDIFQLPPIVQKNSPIEKELFQTIYKSEYFFDSPTYKELNPNFFEFEKVHRQDNVDFINLLDKIRTCSINDLGISKLNKRFHPDFIPALKDFVIVLTSTNYIADSENKKRMVALPYKSFFFKATIEGDFKKDRYPTASILEFKRNSQVMFVKNDSTDNGRRWVNGTIAKMEFLTDDKIEIKLIDGTICSIKKETWENRKFQWDKSKGRITSKVIGTFEQYPLKLAWAITIHKSQGLTFDKINLDLGSGAFVSGQLYTALSRCRTLNGINLKREIKQTDIIEDSRLLKFYDEIENQHTTNVKKS
jgi:ATP-dependent DNA helicase PIF1